MAYRNSISLLLFMCYFTGIIVGFNKTTDMQNLVNDMFESYNKDASPTTSKDTPIALQIEMYLHNLLSLNTKEQSITARGYLEIRWTDTRLSWGGEEYKYGSLERVVVPAKNLWLPEIAIKSSEQKSFFRSDFEKLSTVAVDSNGSIIWMPGGEFSANWAFQVERFPYDDQICSFYIGSWTSKVDEVSLNISYPVDHNMTMNLTANSEWNFVNEKQCIEKDKTNAAYIKFYVQFARKSKYYNSHFMAFLVLLLVLLASTFFMPVKANDKTKAGLQILVSFSVIYLAIKDRIPETSEGISIINIILLTFMSINTVVILISVIVTCIHHGDIYKLGSFLVSLRRTQNGYQRINGDIVDDTSNDSGSSNADTATPDTMDPATQTAAGQIAESQANEDLALRINYCCFVIFCIVGVVALLIFVLFINIHTPTDIQSEVQCNPY